MKNLDKLDLVKSIKKEQTELVRVKAGVGSVLKVIQRALAYMTISK